MTGLFEFEEMSMSEELKDYTILANMLRATACNTEMNRIDKVMVVESLRKAADTIQNYGQNLDGLRAILDCRQAADTSSLRGFVIFQNTGLIAASTVMVDVNHIIGFGYSDEHKTRLFLSNGHELTVLESVKDVCSRIAAAKAELEEQS